MCSWLATVDANYFILTADTFLFGATFLLLRLCIHPIYKRE